MRQRKIYLVFLLITLILGACASQTGNSDDEMISVVEKFQTATNQHNWDLAASYLGDNVIWETPTGNLTGRDNWLTASVKDNGGGITEDVKSRHVEDNKVIVEMVVTGPDFVSPATAEVVVENGKIQRYTVTPP